MLRNLVGITSPDDMDELELRLLAAVMAVQAGHVPLDYSSWEAHKPAYIGAIHAGFQGSYAPMEQFVADAMAAGRAGEEDGAAGGAEGMGLSGPA